MAPEIPRCATCRVTIRPGQNVVFRPDGRVAHVECPEVLCPVCLRGVRPADPIRRDGDNLLHGNCWVKRLRLGGSGDAAHPIAGGADCSPWALTLDRVVETRPSPDELIWLTWQVRQRAAEARQQAATVRRQARAASEVAGGKR
jgi:hypothetical protein